jgi:hypothetical protein
MHHGMQPEQGYRQPGIATYGGHMGGDAQQDPGSYGQPGMFGGGPDMYNPYATGQNFAGQVGSSNYYE